MRKVLIVSGDNATSTAINKTLTYNGFAVHSSVESALAWKHLEEIRFDFVMIDMKIKDESGLAFYKALRQTGNNIPVMMIGEGELDRFILNDLATENYDFILKPLRFTELRDKINNFLTTSVGAEKIHAYGDLKFDSRQQLLIFRNKLLQLSRIELDILMLLAQKSGERIHLKKISKLFGKDGSYSMSAIYYIGVLRQKLKNSGMDALEICFVKDQGYTLSY